MIWALIRKDARLLRNYLRSAVVVTGCSYLVTAIVIHRESLPDASTPWGIAMTLLVLALGSNLGFLSTAFMAALMAGSVFTLERSDRSAEFLACLPPTRKQNLVSKLSVVLVPIGLMIFVHILTNIAELNSVISNFGAERLFKAPCQLRKTKSLLSWPLIGLLLRARKTLGCVNHEYRRKQFFYWRKYLES
jgi:ABC-type transport system involved in multi-copper enzyme maturation permease subunit